MKDKMRSFLKSIHIENIDDFDLDFEMVGRNRFNYQQIDMLITKDRPWEYELLRQFQDGLNTISYPYTLHFSYLVRPTSKDAIALFYDWFRYIYRAESDIQLTEVDNDTIRVDYLDESFKERNQEIVKDYKDFLSFISYDFIEISENVLPPKEEVVEYDEETKAEANEIATAQAEEDIEESKYEPDITDRNDITALVEKEQEEKNQMMEDAMLKQMKKNREIMLKERERQRLNTRGKYQFVEKIDDITVDCGNMRTLRTS